jgi:hypothetical protein
MWLLDTTTIQLKEFGASQRPKYAILSHTWGRDTDEVSFREITQPHTESWRASLPLASKKGYEKILNTCRLAKSRDLDYAWVDTCCIQKESSAELTESINSMFRWYADAEECYVYLEDYPTPSHDSLASYDLSKCKW